MENNALLQVFLFAGFLIVILGSIVMFTVWEAAREAREYFARENEKHRRRGV